MTGLSFIKRERVKICLAISFYYTPDNNVKIIILIPKEVLRIIYFNEKGLLYYKKLGNICLVQ